MKLYWLTKENNEFPGAYDRVSKAKMKLWIYSLLLTLNSKDDLKMIKTETWSVILYLSKVKWCVSNSLRSSLQAKDVNENKLYGSVL